MTTHVCDLYFTALDRRSLPLINIEAHTTILATTSRTILTQTYLNPSKNGPIRELQYSFPLYDGVSVVSFICRIGDRTIVGRVKERTKAKQDYKEAVSQGNNAALFEQLPDASDVFTTSLGNVPAGERVVVEITYIGELKHDAEVDGIRFTIPTSIMPRYGRYPAELVEDNLDITSKGRIQITVDVIMGQESLIQQIQSPSHPIAVSLGTTSIAPRADPVMSKASATLSLGSTGLEKDFVLQVVAKDTGFPTAILETHPTIPNQRALMTTLVPRFSLPSEKPEVVFICDCSGSMEGSNITLAKSALKVFLKSLPIGVKFNICCFGNDYSFLWTKSQTYSQSTLDEAIKRVERIDADMGGTEMLEPIKATIDQRFKDIPLEIILITDGDIWDQDRLFSYLNKQVIESQDPIRVFTLGIGSGASHALVEGVAKAGNGFSQFVGEGEKMQSKVIRMLKGALSPHVTDYTLEVKYSDKDNATDVDDDDFEIVEKVTDSLNIKMDFEDEKKALHEQNPIPLFDTSIDIDKETSIPSDDDSGEARYAHLPPLTPPKLLQAPHIIPPMYAFNRTSVYLLMGPECSQRTPKSVVLRGRSKHGPLEVEIPIQILDTPGETIHQLAAKKAIVELEQGRGWMTQVKDESGTLIKSKYESQFADMMEREAVRLGVEFQVGGKWCSFVAVDMQHENAKQDSTTRECTESSDYDICYVGEVIVKESRQGAITATRSANPNGSSLFGHFLSGSNPYAGFFGRITSSASISPAFGTADTFVRGTNPPSRGVGSVASGATDVVDPEFGFPACRDCIPELVPVGAGAVGAGAVVTGGGLLAAATLHKVDGVWKRTVQVLTTRRANVDEVCPIAKTSHVYYDDDVYDAILTENNTGVTCVTQLIYDTETKAYYAYYRYGEADYKLDGPHETIEAAKNAFQLTYKEKFDVEWTERETAVSDKWTYETKTYETFEEVEEVEEVIDETKALEIISLQERTIEEEPTTVTETATTTTTIADEVIVIEEGAAVFTAAGAVVHGAESAARGVGHVVEAVAIGVDAVITGGGFLAAGTPHNVDGVWKRTVQVLTTRKANVDEICPIAKTSYVYYDDDVYDAALTENNTGATYVTQLIYDTETKAYYVYCRYETDYQLYGPYETFEATKDAFQLIYKERFDVEWADRETAIYDRYTYMTKTYETIEEVEEVEEILDEAEAAAIIARESYVTNIAAQTEITTTTTDEEVIPQEVTETTTTGSKLDILVDLQTFEGFWEWQENLFSCIDVNPEQAEKLAKDNGLGFRVVTTALSIVFFEKKLAEENDTWELMVEKAKVWMEEQIGQEETLEVLQKAVRLIVLDQVQED